MTWRAHWFSWLAIFAGALGAGAQPAAHWWKGNLHTHTLWSDGDDFPEVIVDWYKSRGYDFLALSDHNIMQEGSWVVYATNAAVQKALPKYIRRFGTNWVEQSQQDGEPVVRLKTLSEFRGQFEAPGRFLLLPAEEISDRFGRWPIHLIAANLQQAIKPQRGDSPVEVMQRNINAVLAQRRRTGVPMLVHLAHPNFGWAVTAEDMIQLHGERFFEVYNGHPLVHNEGDAVHASVEHMWDIVNTHRIAERRDLPLLGMAVDDAHHYSNFSPSNANAGRGWVMVRAASLKAETLIHALEAGDFYASSGVVLSDVEWKRNKLTVRVAPQPEATYTVQFVGTRRPVDWRTRPVTGTNGYQLAVTLLYSRGMGEIFSEQPGTNASYTCQGDELFVRAKIISSRLKANGVVPGERECAWTQPVLPAK